MASIEKMLEQTHFTLTSATNDPQLLAILTEYGYGNERLQQGLVLYAAARDSLQTQNNVTFSKVNATQLFLQEWKLARLYLHNDLRLARTALKQHDATQRFLHLNMGQTNNFTGWLKQAKEFYFGLRDQAELRGMVEALGLTDEKIEQGIQRIQRLGELRLQRHTEMSSVANTRFQRNKSFDALEQWMSTFRRLARVFLEPYPAYLVALGLGTETRKQKKSDVLLPVGTSQTASVATVAFAG